MTELSGTFQSQGNKEGDTYYVIDGEGYYIPLYVVKFVTGMKHPIKPGDRVSFVVATNDQGQKRITKIWREKKEDSQKSAPAPTPAPQPTPIPILVKVVQVNEIALKCREVSDNPAKQGLILANLSPAEFGKFTNAGIKEGDEIWVLFDNKGFVTLPADQHLQENIDRMNGPADGETVSPPGGELVKAPPKEPPKVSPKESPKAQEEKTTARPTSQPAPDNIGMCTLTIGGTINLQNYENLKVEISGPAAYRREIIMYLNDTLEMLGKKEPTTGGMIDAWRNRVLGGVEE